MEIEETTPANYLVIDDGKHRMIGRSKQNRALIEENLWGLLKDGNEIYQLDPDDGVKISVIPHEGANEFTLQVGSGGDPVHIGPHNKSLLVAGLVDNEGEAAKAEAMIRLYDDLREDMVREDVINALAEKPPFVQRVELKDGGWLIHGNLLLTWEGDFFHPDTTAYDRSGNVLGEGMSEPAYNLSLDRVTDSVNRELSIGGEEYFLAESEMQFIAKALWAVANAPRGVGR
jgi:hypothetical protein